MAQTNDPSKRRKTEATEEETRPNIIPTDLHEDILLRLPANDLLNFNCVCKDWLRLISSPEFIRKHLHRSEAGRNGTRVLFSSPSEVTEFIYNASGGKNISKKIPYPPGFSGEDTIFLGSCDGLMCLADYNSRQLAVYNPSTRKSDIRIVDEVELEFNNVTDCCWFGHHPSTGEYVLVIGNHLSSWPLRLTIQVHNFSCKLMSMVSCSYRWPVIPTRNIGILLHGNLHWSVLALTYGQYNFGCGYIALAYDFQKNKILEIMGPTQSCFTLGVVDGCLFAICQPGWMFELWIMKEYCVEKSWTKYRNIEEYDNCTSRTLSPLGFSWNGDLIIETWNDESKFILIYNYGDEEASPVKVHESNRRFVAVVCIDSLVSPALILGQ